MSATGDRDDTISARAGLADSARLPGVRPRSRRGARAASKLGDEARSRTSTPRPERRGIKLTDDCAARPRTLRADRPVAGATSDSLQLFLRDIAQRPLLTAAEEVELAKRIERGDQDAKQQMIESNLRLVVSNAKRYRGLGLPSST